MFTRRLTMVLAVLLLGFAALVAVLVRQVALSQEQEALQRLSQGLARHIVGHWPAITRARPDPAAQAERDAVLAMLMVVNPGVQVYLLDADGQVQHYLGEPGMVQQHQVDLDAVRSFLAGARLPILGTDPMGGPQRRIFSAAMFPPGPDQTRPPGYLYIVLDGAARDAVSGTVSRQRVWQGAALVGGLGLLVVLAGGMLLLRRLTRPLQQLASRMQAYAPDTAAAASSATATASATASATVAPLGKHAGTPAMAADEVQAITQAWTAMTARVQQQAEREARQVAEHREMMAGVAHDLRTPLTALHGHLEALGSAAAADQPRLLGTALAQSDKVRRLSQQLFELASLQSTQQVLHRERFSLGELVGDAVQKFNPLPGQPPVVLDGPDPGRLELDGDLQLVERALTNLIDNALRHAAGPAPVRVRLQRQGMQAEVLVQDGGPGLPAELLQRLDTGQSLRDPPLRRPGGGIGGLGLAIAQRVAQLHGGSLRPLASPDGGTRLCLALPLAGPA